jgi:hypothetical protein
VNLTNARLVGAELRYGRYGFYCSNGRKHVFHHLFSETSGTSMDIGPCEGDACPFARTHGSHVCQSYESCLDTRRITLDSGRDLRVYFHPRGGWQGRGKNRHRACTVTIMRAGSLEPGWYHELAQQAEAADGLIASWRLRSVRGSSPRLARSAMNMSGSKPQRPCRRRQRGSWTTSESMAGRCSRRRCPAEYPGS